MKFSLGFFLGLLGLISTTATVCLETALAEFTSISAGFVHSCALSSLGEVRCWGNNNYGQLGDGTSNTSNRPVSVLAIGGTVSKISAGAFHTCALTSSGGVKCWGSNFFGQLGDGTTDDRMTPVDVSGLTAGVVAIAAGVHHTCAVMSSGGVRCWGWNHYGQLGDTTSDDRLTPVNVSGLTSGVKLISTKELHTCVVLESGAVRCWGHNYNGQLGNTTPEIAYAPLSITGLESGVTSISTGISFSCAIQNGGVKCWGLNDQGQLGDSSLVSSAAPVNVSGLSVGAAALASGGAHTCSLSTSGGIKCWGNNASGQLGNGEISESSTPVAVTGLASGVKAIAAGENQTCALNSSGGVKCWGSNFSGQVGNGQTTDQPLPADILIWSIAGQVNVRGVPLSGVTLGCNNPAIFSTNTNSSGAYRISEVPDATPCNLVASRAGYSFVPASQSLVVSDNIVQNFEATLTAVDTQAPSSPTNLSATATSTTQINLAWTASTDPNVAGQTASGVSVYLIERCLGSTCSNFVQVGSFPTNSYSDTGLAAGTTYRYRIRAVDGAGNLSPYSSVVTRATLLAPPVLRAPSGLRVG